MKLFSGNWISEACILATLSHGDAYGYEMARPNALNISESALYTILRRLCDSGCLESYSMTHDARLRKFYRITPEGRNQLERLKKTWKAFRDTVDRYLAGDGELRI
jgi:PadR family transcriptional regulator PadR